MILRPFVPADREHVLALNNDAVPAVSRLAGSDLDRLVAWAESVTVAAEDTAVLGFLIGLTGPGLPYGSDNYAWLSDRYSSFLYVDRVVVGPAAKGCGVGQSLYRHIVAVGASRFPVLLAEVNTQPRNEESLRFHERFGFTSVGHASTEGGTKEVVYLELALPAD
ncbi:MAG: GNAT family N-acetyltransferase [Acidimicrobiia bacterium]|nr:GNAT family N-acetyltransferase [Acidimicrobiia bacterium]